MGEVGRGRPLALSWATVHDSPMGQRSQQDLARQGHGRLLAGEETEAQGQDSSAAHCLQQDRREATETHQQGRCVSC